MKTSGRTDLALTAAVLFLGASMVWSGLSVLRRRGSEGGGVQPLNLAELLAVGGAGAGIIMLCWWLLALSCACVSAAAGATGDVRIRRFTAACSPAFMRRAVIAVVGLNLMAAPLIAAAPPPGIDPLWQAQTVSSAAHAATPTVPPPVAVPPVEPHWRPITPTTGPDLLVRPSTRHTPPSAGPGTPGGNTAPLPGSSPEVVVKSGDNLWSIVAAALGPFSTDADVARAWPQWYNANRNTIGTDPNYLLPGQVLHPPATC